MSREIVEDDIHKVKELLEISIGESNYTNLKRLGGLTNHTYKVSFNDGRDLTVRIPGPGTEKMINRKNEMVSTKLACNLGIDTKLLYFGDNGEKVTEFIPNAITMSSELLHTTDRINKIAEILLKLHSCQQNTNILFEIFDMASNYEKIIFDNSISIYSDYYIIKENVMDIKAEVDAMVDINMVPCHNDPLCENWIESNGKMYLIDWEYAGMNDYMWDLADISIEAEFDEECDKHLLISYFKREPDEIILKHFIANKVYVDYLWTLWAKARVPYDGQPMEDWALERYTRLKKFIDKYKTL